MISSNNLPSSTNNKEILTGLDVYRIYISIKVHLYTKDYIYVTPIPAKWEKYQTHKFYDVFEALAKKYDGNVDKLKEVFLANLLTAPDMPVSHYLGKAAEKVYLKWIHEFDDIEEIFFDNLVKLMNYVNTEEPDELFQKIQEQVGRINSSLIQVVSSLQEIVEDKVIVTKHTNTDLISEIKKYPVNFTIVLDEIMMRYRNFS